MSYKALFTIAAALDHEIHQMDVKIGVPPEQSPVWIEAGFPVDLGFELLVPDIEILVKGQYIAVYVDDLLIAGLDLGECRYPECQHVRLHCSSMILPALTKRITLKNSLAGAVPRTDTPRSFTSRRPTQFP